MELKKYLEDVYNTVYGGDRAEPMSAHKAFMEGAKAVAGYIVEAVKDDPTYGDLTTREERMNSDVPLEREPDNGENAQSGKGEVDEARESSING